MTSRSWIWWGAVVAMTLSRPTFVQAAGPSDRPGSRWSEDADRDVDRSYRYSDRGDSETSRARLASRDSDRRSGYGSYDSSRSGRYQRTAQYSRPVEEIDRPPAYSYDRGAQGPVSDTYLNADGPIGPDGYGPGNFYDDGYYGDGCYDGCDTCWNCPGPIYARGEYLLWWLKGDSAPALVTTSPQGTSRADAGVLGKSTTSVLFGDTQFNQNARSGGRVVLGWWVDQCCRLEGDFFILGQASENFNQTSTGNPILARPFFNLGTAAQDAVVVAYPNQVTGSINASETSSFLGAGVHATYNMLCWDNCNYSCRVDALLGYRYLRLRDTLNINSNSMTLGTAAPVSLAVSDSFATTNNFNGAELGMLAEAWHGCWYFTAIGRLGIGGTWENVTINGSTTATANNQSTTSAGGLLAMPSNIGSFQHTGFTVVPALELKLGYDITCNCRLTVGYDVMYWSRVARPAEQIDTSVNTSQASGGTLTGVPGPLFSLRESDLWVQGLSVGGEIRY